MVLLAIRRGHLESSIRSRSLLRNAAQCSCFSYVLVHVETLRVLFHQTSSLFEVQRWLDSKDWSMCNLEEDLLNLFGTSNTSHHGSNP